MKKFTNIVLYAIEGGARRPLISVGAQDDRFALARVQHAASQEYRRCDAAGVPHSELKLVRETRAADENRTLTFAEYCEVDPATGADVGESHPEIGPLFEVKK